MSNDQHWGWVKRCQNLLKKWHIVPISGEPTSMFTSISTSYDHVFGIRSYHVTNIDSWPVGKTPWFWWNWRNPLRCPDTTVYKTLARLQGRYLDLSIGAYPKFAGWFFWMIYIGVALWQWKPPSLGWEKNRWFWGWWLVWISGETTSQIWGFPHMGVPPNAWFIRGNPIKMDDLGLPPWLWKPS